MQTKPRREVCTEPEAFLPAWSLKTAPRGRGGGTRQLAPAACTGAACVGAAFCRGRTRPCSRPVKTFPGGSGGTDVLTRPPAAHPGTGRHGVHPTPLTNSADLQGRGPGGPGAVLTAGHPEGEAAWEPHPVEARACCACGYPTNEASPPPFGRAGPSPRGSPSRPSASPGSRPDWH